MLFFMALVLGAVLLGATRRPRKQAPLELPRATSPLTRHEQAMYFRLQGALPGLVVLSQVSFSALLTARSMAARSTFNRKRADFVVCERSFKVVAIVELDDGSHDGNEGRDGKRDALLEKAGYRVLRYRGIPDIDRVQADFAPPPLPSALGEDEEGRIDPT
ncbi:DUF2726 domain-containing protein [Variovorax sp. J22P168]|uniref:DUF2726 domain-containing protein n=1 Tax=Variovorax jilinensis TaxID=3053513 RepID=UPI002575BD6D|nr:DUF2726 domain-containing protein [Variovorax sp. J22P168]MDM0011999.1 DUF2726 domain-containing protein [Variovorax sp. J22P168]